MRQGTTPIHTFGIPLDKSIIKSVKITYKQGDKIVLCKRTEDCDIEDGKIITHLTQNDTLLFDYKSVVKFQLKILTNDGNVHVSDVMRKGVYECLDDEVMT